MSWQEKWTHRCDISVSCYILTFHRTTLHSIKQKYSVKKYYKIITSNKAQLVHTYESIEWNVFKTDAADFLTKGVNYNNLVLSKAFPVETYYRARGFQEAETPKFQDTRHMKMVRLSALHTGRLYLPRNITGNHFCCGPE